MVTDKNKIKDLTAQYCEKKKSILFAYLFGSYAKNTLTKLSDVDIGVYIDPASPRPAYGYEAEIIAELMLVLKRNDIDVVVLNKAPIFLRYQVINYGELLFSRSDDLDTQFRFETYRDYFDTQYIRDVQNFYLLSGDDNG